LDDDTTRVFVNSTVEGGSMYDAGISSGDLVYAIDGVETPSIDAMLAAVAKHKVGDVVNVDVEQRKVRATVPMKIAGRREMKIVSYESLGIPLTEQVRTFRKNWLDSRR
jgi:S1-C subfamily serine protease